MGFSPFAAGAWGGPRPDGRERTPRFAGPPTFALLPRRDEVAACRRRDRRASPFDSGASYRPGARFGPAHVRAGLPAAAPLQPGARGVARSAAQQVADAGDIACNPFDIAEAIGQIEAGAPTLLGRRRPAARHRRRPHDRAARCCGPPAQRYGPVALVHFDAHLDTWDTYFGAPSPTAPRSAAPPRRACSHDGAACTSASAARCTRERPRPTTPSSASGSCTAMDVETQRRRRRRRADPRPGRRRAAVRLDRHRRARPGARPGHRHARGRRPDQPRAARHPARPGRPARSSAPTWSRSRPPTTTPRSPRSPPRTSATSCSR